MKGVCRAVGQAELSPQVHAKAAEDAHDRGLVTGPEEQGRAGRSRERRELGRRQELGDRRAHLAALVDDDVGEAPGTPFLGDLLEPPELASRQALGATEEAHAICARRRHRTPSRASTRSRPGSPGRSAGRACRCRTGASRPPYDIRRNGVRGRRPASAPERGDDRRSTRSSTSSCSANASSRSSWLNSNCRSARRSSSRQQRGDLVVAVDAADHEQLLEELRALRQREERPGLQSVGTRKSRAPSGVGLPMIGVSTSTKPAVSISCRMIEITVRTRPDVSLHPLAPHVEPAVAKAQRLVDVLLVELERQRRRACGSRRARRPAPRPRRSTGSGSPSRRCAGRPRLGLARRTRFGARARPRRPRRSARG